MKIRRSLSATAVPVALSLACAVPSVAAATTRVSFRVEGARKTLLAPATVAVPTSGSIIKGGTPAGTCPADSAAGALNAATHGRWGGTYSSGLGVEVTSILGTTAQYTKGSYWEFFVNDRVASDGVCDTKVRPGEQFLFAQVPARGASEYPIVLKAPKVVHSGRTFTVKSFVYGAKGLTPLKVTFTADDLARSRGTHHASFGAGSTNRAGLTHLTLGDGPATYDVIASAKGEVRSAPVTIKVVR